jgi:hypothetical protein
LVPETSVGDPPARGQDAIQVSILAATGLQLVKPLLRVEPQQSEIVTPHAAQILALDAVEIATRQLHVTDDCTIDRQFLSDTGRRG